MKLRQSMVLEREAFTLKHDNLSREVEQLELIMQQQKQVVQRCRRELMTRSERPMIIWTSSGFT